MAHRPRWVAAFLVALYETGGNVQCSAERAGVSRRAVYDYAHRSTSFTRMVAEVRARLESELVDRARLRAS